MKKLTFEVHTYAPELNKVFSNGINITSLFCSSTLMKLTKSYADNCRIIRAAKNSELLRRYILVATRLDGSTETRFCNRHTVSKALEQYKKAKQYYSDTTKLNFKRLY